MISRPATRSRPTRCSNGRRSGASTSNSIRSYSRRSPRPRRSTTPRSRSITDGAVKNGTTTPIAIARPIERLRAVALRR
jgi:hypothetical protein